MYLPLPIARPSALLPLSIAPGPMLSLPRLLPVCCPGPSCSPGPRLPLSPVATPAFPTYSCIPGPTPTHSDPSPRPSVLVEIVHAALDLQDGAYDEAFAGALGVFP